MALNSLFKPLVKFLGLNGLNNYIELIHRARELQDLSNWARRKRLSDVRNYYQRRLRKTQKLIAVFEDRRPLVTEVGQWLITFQEQIAPRK